MAASKRFLSTAICCTIRLQSTFCAEVAMAIDALWDSARREVILKEQKEAAKRLTLLDKDNGGP
jgi:hypothetical protein